ncbi:MAG: SEC-C domain-containing protein, partial [Bacteroidales bacterium]|nr:SEC-C domain-containing protein [Bacteroidales bacterium]
ERAQKKVEENNFGIRKRLLEYDDVMNNQREVVYSRRRHALYGERIEMDIANMMFDLCESLVLDYKDMNDFEGFKMDLIRFLAIECPVDEEQFLQEKADAVTDIVYQKALSTFENKNTQMAEAAWPVIKDVYEKASHQYVNILVPITDGQKTLQINANLKRAYETRNRELVKAFEKSTVLATIDEDWKEHLREMDELKQSVQNASYEQKDPLLIYKLESFDLFKNMMNRVNKEVVSLLMKGNIPIQQPEQVREAQAIRKLDMSKYQTSKTDMEGYGSSNATGEGGAPQKQKKIQPVRVEKKIGRNDLCPCGSGKKYKHCHGAAGAQASS